MADRKLIFDVKCRRCGHVQVMNFTDRLGKSNQRSANHWLFSDKPFIDYCSECQKDTLFDTVTLTRYEEKADLN